LFSQEVKNTILASFLLILIIVAFPTKKVIGKKILSERIESCIKHLNIKEYNLNDSKKVCDYLESKWTN